MRLILPMPGNEPLASALAQAGGWELGALETRRFPDEERYLRIVSDVGGRAVDIVCTLARPDAAFLSLIFAADAARDLGATEVTLVAPYLAYMRQDRRFHDGEAVTSRTFARMLSATFERLVTVDPHLHRYKSLAELYTLQSQVLHAAPLLADWISEEIDRPLIIGPDEESEQWVAAVAQRAGAPHVVLRKIRHGDRSVEIAVPDLSEHAGRRAVLIDDIASSGRTLIEAAKQLPDQGFAKPVCAVVHGVFAGEAFDELSAVAERIVSTDSVPHPSNAIGLAPLLADALLASRPVAGVPRRRRPAEADALVDEAGAASFPASDPPGWTGGN